MASFWIKLYTEFLDDVKMGQLPEYLQLRFIKLLLMAKEFDQDGLLPPVSALAWRLRTDAGSMSETLSALGLIGVVRETAPGIWLVANFSKRQAAVSTTQRVQAFRDRKRNVTESVTNSSKKCNENETDVTFPSSSSSSSSSFSSSDSDSLDSLTAAESASLYAQWQTNGSARAAERLYQQVTGQISIPAGSQSQALADLQTVLDHYGRNLERAVTEGKEVFAAWCHTTGKSGRRYSPTNTAWLGRWLERIAPRPAEAAATAASVAERIRELAEAARKAR